MNNRKTYSCGELELETEATIHALSHVVVPINFPKSAS
jgi:hypothetical protein